MSKPLVSVLSPVFNSEKYLRETVESILNQTYSNFEFLILDDGSTDESLTIANEYKNRDSRVKVYQNKKNLGISKSRNILVGLAKGKYIVWQDSDDISYKKRIEKQVTFMERNPDVGICGASIQSFSDKKTLDIRRYKTRDDEIRKVLFKMSPIAQPAAIIRKKTLDRVGLYDPSLPPSEDIDMTFRIGCVSSLANLPDILLKYREHKGSATFKKMRTQIIKTLEVRKKYWMNKNFNHDPYDYFAFIVTVLSIFFPPDFVVSTFKTLRKLFL